MPVPLFGTFLPGSETLTAVFARYADTANLILWMDVKECLVLSKISYNVVLHATMCKYCSKRNV
jgi:hypothetical protein